MSHVLVTGSTDGVGRATAEALLADGHSVVVHARSDTRLEAVQDLLARGATSVIGDLAELDQVRDLARQVRALGPVDAIVHNAGVLRGAVLPVNVTAPYLLTALVPAPRHVYLSSSMHRGGRPDLTGVDLTRAGGSRTYSDAKLLVTVLMAALARRLPHLTTHAVDPGWVPTRMGGSGASDDLALAHPTQVWLATTQDPEALVGGRYWHHRRIEQPHPAVHDEAFQDELLAVLATGTGTDLPVGP